MNTEVHNLLLSFASCHSKMKELAMEMRKENNAVSVVHWHDLHGVSEVFRLEEYVDVEYSDGTALSWRIEISLSREHGNIEADVRRIHSGGQDLVVTVANYSVSTLQDFSLNVVVVADRLSSTNQSL